MVTIKDEANNYTSGIKDISELAEVSVDISVNAEANVEFPYKYVELNGERYKVAKSVLASLQAILKSNPNLKKFKVSKQGQGMNTRYVVIPLG